jgi:hypothetical protein
MRRYGDNVTYQDITDETPKNAASEMIFRGGCAATFGSFAAPGDTDKNLNTAQKSLFEELFTFFKGKEKKTQENI